jgi:hypothetical protein
MSSSEKFFVQTYKVSYDDYEGRVTGGWTDVSVGFNDLESASDHLREMRAAEDGTYRLRGERTEVTTTYPDPVKPKKTFEDVRKEFVQYLTQDPALNPYRNVWDDVREYATANQYGHDHLGADDIRKGAALAANYLKNEIQQRLAEASEG